jgi:phage-related minor tail protein
MDPSITDGAYAGGGSLIGAVLAYLGLGSRLKRLEEGVVYKDTFEATTEGIKAEFTALRNHIDTRIDDLRDLIKQNGRG